MPKLPSFTKESATSEITTSSLDISLEDFLNHKITLAYLELNTLLTPDNKTTVYSILNRLITKFMVEYNPTTEEHLFNELKELNKAIQLHKSRKRLI